MVTLGTLPAGYVASRSADGAAEFIHVLNPPAGDTLVLPALADDILFTVARNVATGRELRLSQLPNGGYSLTLASADTWSTGDTAVELTRTLRYGEQIWIGANMWGSHNGATLLPQGIESRYAAWEMSDSANQQIQTTCTVPADWNTFGVDLYWAPTRSGAGEAVITLVRAQGAPGGSLAEDDVSVSPQFSLSGDVNVLQVVTAFEGLRSVPGP